MNKINFTKLIERLQKLDYISFAIVFGSAKNGIIKKKSDLDLGVYFCKEVKVGFDEISAILRITTEVFPNIECDLARLNSAGPILRHEALKGRILFISEKEIFVEFYAKTCAEYEDKIFWMNKQLEYRGIESEI